MAAPPASEASPRGGASGSPLILMGLSPDAPAEDIAYVLGDVRRAQTRVDAKRAALQEQIAAAASSSRRGNKRRTAPPRRAPLPVANNSALLPPAAADDDDPGACGYARKGGAGAVRRRLRAAAANAKKERKRLEAIGGDLEEALVDAREMLALRGGGGTA